MGIGSEGRKTEEEEEGWERVVKSEVIQERKDNKK